MPMLNALLPPVAANVQPPAPNASPGPEGGGPGPSFAQALGRARAVPAASAGSAGHARADAACATPAAADAAAECSASTAAEAAPDATAAARKGRGGSRSGDRVDASRPARGGALALAARDRAADATGSEPPAGSDPAARPADGGDGDEAASGAFDLSAWLGLPPPAGGRPADPADPPGATVAAGAAGGREAPAAIAAFAGRAPDAPGGDGTAERPPESEPDSRPASRAERAGGRVEAREAAPERLQPGDPSTAGLAVADGAASDRLADATGAAQAGPAPAAAPSAAGWSAAVGMALPAAPNGIAATGDGGPAPTWAGELVARLGSAEFAPALGHTLVTLVRDGIEQAQLRLNPAELGPITVQIRIDGTQAQIDFAAAQAGTRDALQEAVPALAGALREAGLTLAGGGVFERPRDPRPDPARDTSRGTPARRTDEAAAVGAAAAGGRRLQGAVDLYA